MKLKNDPYFPILALAIIAALFLSVFTPSATTASASAAANSASTVTATAGSGSTATAAHS